MLPRSGVVVCFFVVLACLFLALRNLTFTDLGADSRCLLAEYDDQITELSLKGCGLTRLPPEIARFSRLKKLDAANNRLSDLPPLPKSLEIAFFLGNRFTQLPASLSSAENLMMLSFKTNQLTDIPPGVLPKSLKWLILTGNKLTKLPHDMGRLNKLRKVMLSNNQLEHLPSSMSDCTEIELLRLANNRFESIPSFVTTLPKLAFLAVAGNPAIQPPASWNEESNEVDFSSLKLKEKLGEGTSGRVYKSSYGGKDVAVKVYKTALSSDGRNIDEVHLAASLSHAHVVKVLGVFHRPSLGTVLELTTGYKSLGKPPNFATITRDTYAEGTRFSGRFIVNVATSIAAAGKYIHSKQVMHGDMYAHNILVDSEGHAKLSDFGAGFWYGNVKRGKERFEQMEVRAFGFLLGELLERKQPDGEALQQDLHDGKTANEIDYTGAEAAHVLVAKGLCAKPLGKRPSFAELVRILAGGQ